MVSIRRVMSGSLGGMLVMVARLSELQATPAQDAQQFVENFADWAIEEIIKPKLSDTERASRLHMLIEGRADTPAVAQFVLGRYWRASNAPTCQAFLSAFEVVLTLRLLPLREQYAGERLVVDSARERPGDRICILV